MVEKENSIAVLEEHIGILSPVRHEVLGDGQEGTLDDGKPTQVVVQIFPDTQTARVQTGLTDLTVRRAILSLDEPNHALLIRGHSGSEWASVQIYEGGSVVFASIPEGTERRGPSIPADREVAPSAEIESTTEGDQERVSLTGRIGYKPQFRTTPKGTLVGSFSLAVHEGPDKTTWHKIVAFGDRAEKLQAAGFGKGDEIEVVGYPHQRDRTGKDGETKTITEIYAAAMHQTRQSRPESTDS